LFTNRAFKRLSAARFKYDDIFVTTSATSTL